MGYRGLFHGTSNSAQQGKQGVCQRSNHSEPPTQTISAEPASQTGPHHPLPSPPPFGIPTFVRSTGLEPGLRYKPPRHHVKEKAKSGEKGFRTLVLVGVCDMCGKLVCVRACKGCWVPTVKPDAARRVDSRDTHTPPIHSSRCSPLGVGSRLDWLAHRTPTYDGRGLSLVTSLSKQTKQT